MAAESLNTSFWVSLLIDQKTFKNKLIRNDLELLRIAFH